MATITWQNVSGSLGNYASNTNFTLQFLALSDDLTSIVRYKLLSGLLPQGTKFDPIQLSLDGVLSGTFSTVFTKETYTFTIRAFDQFGNIKDRTFSMDVSVPNVPKFNMSTGTIASIFDSTWLDLPILYNNPAIENNVTITKSSGSLPPGLYIQDGRIKGYATPPLSAAGSPITKSYSFTLQLKSSLGNDSAQYSIEVSNQRLTSPPHNRTPAITNSRPLAVVSTNDPYYRFYLPSTNNIPTIKANEYFTFKILGQDFDNDVLRYSFNSLPPGLSGDSTTGWITGVVSMDSMGINDYVFNVSISKLTKPLVTTAAETFYLRVVNEITEDIQWVSDSDLGVIYNNTVSEIDVVARSTRELQYVFVSGSLPPNLTLTSSGSISGRVAFQPTTELLSAGDETTFTFTVQVYAISYPSLRSNKTFTLTVKQYYDSPTETVYFKAAPSIQGRTILESLLTDTTLIPTEYLYRADDQFFGKSTNINIVQAYGITASLIPTYLDAIQRNHYTRNITLGKLNTAIARNESGDIIYEVVYADIVDDLVNENGVSIPSSINWPRNINLNLGPWTINNSELHASYSFDDTYYTSLSPGSVKTLYPGSLDNMRTTLVTHIDQNTDSNLLPKWMTSQQANGNTLGFIKCWVICYTLPGYAETVKANIENDWGHSLNEIDCTFDRYMVDKSTTYNWDLNLLIPAWTQLPSEVPDSTNLEKHDLVVLFPRKTILPK